MMVGAMIIINRGKVSQGTDTTTKKRRRTNKQVGLEDRIVIGLQFSRHDVTKNHGVMKNHDVMKSHDVKRSHDVMKNVIE